MTRRDFQQAIAREKLFRELIKELAKHDPKKAREFEQKDRDIVKGGRNEKVSI